MKRIQELERLQREEFVPRNSKDEMTELLNFAEVMNCFIFQEKLTAVKIQNETLQSELNSKHEYYQQLEAQLTEKDRQYQFLLMEYNSLNAGV